MSGFFDDPTSDDDQPRRTDSLDPASDSFSSTRAHSHKPPARESSYPSSSFQDTSSHRHDTSSRRGVADSSSVGRGRTPDLDEILAEIDMDNEGEGKGKQAERSIVQLERCLANEQGAPELLTFPRELVERIVRDLAARVSSPFSRFHCLC